MAPKALFFAPHAFIWPHALPEGLIADALRHEGLDVHVVTCDGLLGSWCVAMESTGAREDLPAEAKQRICQKCRSNRDLLQRRFGFAHSALEDHVTDAEREEIEQCIALLRPEELLEFQLDGYPIGRASLYNFSIGRKKAFERDFSADEWDAFQLHLRSCLRAFFAGRRLLDQHQPDFLFQYSSTYSINLMVRLQAERRGIRCFSLFAGNNWANRLQRMHISELDSFTGYATRARLWDERFHALPATQADLDRAGRFMATLLGGTSSMVYGGGTSRPDWQALRAHWGIAPEQKVLFLATSSYDELHSAQAVGALPVDIPMAFPSQLAWIEATIRFVAARPDLFLIIRVHPRELPNQRERIGSAHAEQLRALLQNLPGNVRVNWPDDGLSLYDWLEVIDLGLTSWSSAGKELALWGLPNLSYTEFAFYPKRDLGWVGPTPEAYFEAIDEALRGGWSRERLLLAYRWLTYELEGAVFDLSDTVSVRFDAPPSLPWRLFDRLTGRRFVEHRRLPRGRRSLAQSALIAERVVTNRPSEEVLEPTRKRLTPEREAPAIVRVAAEAARALWGPEWAQSAPASPLRSQILKMIAESAN